jgi:hypothetical protein
MNEQFALRLHSIGDAIFLISGTCGEFIHEFSCGVNLSDGLNELSVDVKTSGAVLLETPIETCCFPINANLGATLARKYRELFGVSEDTETDSE